VSIQDGNVPKHMHPNTNEMQFILEGTGTIWLGDKEVTVKPADLVVIPKGTPHGGNKPIGRPMKAIAIKTPPQAPDEAAGLTARFRAVNPGRANGANPESRDSEPGPADHPGMTASIYPLPYAQAGQLNRPRRNTIAAEISSRAMHSARTAS
jgi:hypothetical protein